MAKKPNHDQRLKVLLKEFFQQFLLCFFPAWEARFDFSQVDWLDKEVFLDPPRGESRELDLVARLRPRAGAPPPRMFEYYVQLRRDLGVPVLPIGLFLRVGLEGIGWDAYEEHFWEHRLLRFEYAYVGLPALDGERYALGENLLGVALSALMRVPQQRKAELYAEALKRLALSRENDFRRFLLTECLEAYSALDADQQQRVRSLLATEPYLGVRPAMITTYERGAQEGERRLAMRQLQAKFGPLSAEVQARLEAMPQEQFDAMMLEYYKAASLKELGLEG